MENSESNNKRLWEINEQIYKQKKELDQELKALEIEKEQLKIDKEEIQRKNSKLWDQSKAIHVEKERINKLRLEIEARHKEITDSIVYAQRLQTAILPQNKLISSFLNEWFILFKPKDIVSGDFYWFEEKNDRIIFAAADSTGHGVPGAMVSVICNSGLNRSLKEFNLEDPGEILTKTREIVIEAFEKSHDEVKDGMDIALVSMSKEYNSDGSRDLNFAGAHNPLWILRKETGKIEEIKSDRQPVGKYYKTVDFNTHSVKLQKGDIIYIFSDGYDSQFGGEKGKKFKSLNMKNLICSIKDKTMTEQKEIMNNRFEEWRGNLEQVDDVVVFGIKV